MCFIVDWPKQIDNIKTLMKSNFEGDKLHVKSRLGFGKIESLQGENMQVNRALNIVERFKILPGKICSFIQKIGIE